ncbi:hypothetical protein F2Q70_00024075 [Brassica cretica]|uniref:START domain-containing protein n=1 Tax=Brassica cretica TaxID=69181 RepID=A0A8S9GX51_BRACR|nr:hypothetical protein F2Q70_00024075 [Brassica cretica]
MLDSLTSVQRQQTFEALTSYGMNPYNQPSSLESQTIQPQLLPQMDISQLSETAATAVEELKRLFRTDEALWVMSSIDRTYVIDQESYEKFSHSIKHFRNLSARVESSKDITVVPIEATSLIDMFLDSEKWKMLFPTIVNEAKTIHTLGSELPINENCNVLQVIWEQLHILSPLVPPREFMIVRCCQQIGEGLWIIADVSQDSQHIVNSDQASPSCYKRPSGCLIRSLPNAHTEVRWIEHVEVDHTTDTHKMYRELVSGSSGYGARRWIVTLERMCERMALSSILIMPATDWSESMFHWDVLCRGNAITETARIFTGSSGTNCINLLQPTPPWDIGQNMVQEPHKKMMVLQECYMDALGGMIVYSPLDMATMSIAASGEVDPSKIPILPSGFTISSDNSEGTLLMLAFQILNSDENSKTRSVSEIAVDRVSRLISQTVQSIKLMLNCPPE